MFKLRMLMGSLLENRQSTINTSPAHGKKKMLQYIPVTGKFEVMVYNTCFLQQTSFLVIWFDCLEKKGFFAMTESVMYFRNIYENGEAKDDFVY